jgi:hypothetical protein
LFWLAWKPYACSELVSKLDNLPQSFGFYARIRLLSIDIAMGALGGGCMVAQYLDQEMPWSWYVILPLAVWSIYTADHLLDAMRLKDTSSTPRHQFHHKYFGILMSLALLSAATAVGLALFFLGLQGFYFGLGMGALVLTHLALVKFVGERTSPFLVKELGVALVYAAGIWGLPLILSGKWGTREAMVPATQFLLLALANLLEFSLYEYEIDKADGHTSFVQAIGRKGAIRFIRLVLASMAGLGAFLLSTIDGRPVLRIELTFGLMALVLAALIYKPTWFAANERYRAWGDAAFLFPFLFPLLALL